MMRRSFLYGIGGIVTSLLGFSHRGCKPGKPAGKVQAQCEWCNNQCVDSHTKQCSYCGFKPGKTQVLMHIGNGIHCAPSYWYDVAEC